MTGFDTRPRLSPDADTDRATLALPAVTNQLSCPGCARRFTPVRTTQRHCWPACRVVALRKRRASLAAMGGVKRQEAQPQAEEQVQAEKQAQRTHIGAVLASAPAPVAAQAPDP